MAGNKYLGLLQQEKSLLKMLAKCSKDDLESINSLESKLNIVRTALSNLGDLCPGGEPAETLCIPGVPAKKPKKKIFGSS